MNAVYMQGFIDKCAAHGVDPEQLLKRAARGDIVAKAVQELQTLGKMRGLGTTQSFADSLQRYTGRLAESSPELFATGMARRNMIPP